MEQELTEGYVAEQAARILTQNSGRPVKPDYVRKLAQKDKIRSVLIGARLRVYNKEDIDAYIVEERGAKAGRAAQDRAQSKRRAKVADHHQQKKN